MAEYPQINLLRGISSGPREEALNDIVTILGTTAPWFAPFWEAQGSVVSAIGAGGNLTSSDEAAAVTLQSEFSPIAMPCGLYHYGLVPGGNLHLYAADNAAFTFGNGTADTPFSCGLWWRPNAVASKDLIAKYRAAATSAREWRMGTDASSFLFLELYDESADTTEIATSTTALVAGQWVFLVASYDGTESAPVINLYQNATLINDGTSVESGLYVAMEDLTCQFMVGASGVNTSPQAIAGGRIAMPFVTGKALSTAEVLSLYNLMRPMVGLDVS